MKTPTIAAAFLAVTLGAAACGTTDPGDTPTPTDTGYHGTPHAAKTPKPKHHHKPKVRFLVEGDAPQGVDITYGSDSDNRQGNGMPFAATLPAHSDAMYYAVTAQLNGSGDITCTVQIGKHVKMGHASGSYNICSAQLNAGPFGGWD